MFRIPTVAALLDHGNHGKQEQGDAKTRGKMHGLLLSRDANRCLRSARSCIVPTSTCCLGTYSTMSFGLTSLAQSEDDRRVLRSEAIHSSPMATASSNPALRPLPCRQPRPVCVCGITVQCTDGLKTTHAVTHRTLSRGGRAGHDSGLHHKCLECGTHQRRREERSSVETARSRWERCQLRQS